jgi:anaerobic dimethyl sulfoxide reductase subunit C
VQEPDESQGKGMNLREWALPVYTILMQLATGALLALWVIRTVSAAQLGKEQIVQMSRRPTAVILCTALVAIIGSHFHLSRPLFSFLAILNIRSSWLSREIGFTVLFFLSVSALTLLQWLRPRYTRLQTILGWVAIGLGSASIFCMSAIYLLPTQPVWDSLATTVSFFATTLLLGAVSMAALLILDLRFGLVREPLLEDSRPLVIRRALAWLTAMAAIAMIVLVVLNVTQIKALENGNELAQLSLQLLLGLYRPLFIARLALLLGGVMWLVVSVWTMRRRETKITELLTPVYMSCLLLMIGEILGRFLFYAMHIRVGI